MIDRQRKSRSRQMRKSLPTGLAFGLCVWASTATAQELDVSKPLLCSLAEAMQCEYQTGACRSLRPAEVNAPDFIEIDPVGKTLAAPFETQKSAIERSEVIDGKLFLQGAEDGFQSREDGMGWTILVTQATGRMVLSAASEDTGFVFFGACIPR
jgi:hypothetical protein